MNGSGWTTSYTFVAGFAEIFNPQKATAKQVSYTVPENRKQFFALVDLKESEQCCDDDTQKNCCAAEEKSSCCGSEKETATCGCV